TAVEHRTQQVQGLLLSTDSDVFLFAVRWAFEALIQVRFANCWARSVYLGLRPSRNLMFSKQLSSS
ncbi:hypothetical protein WDW86_10320, partial [Bdellovibrionota bacterium FG-2]